MTRSSPLWTAQSRTTRFHMLPTQFTCCWEPATSRPAVVSATLKDLSSHVQHNTSNVHQLALDLPVLLGTTMQIRPIPTVYQNLSKLTACRHVRELLRLAHVWL